VLAPVVLAPVAWALAVQVREQRTHILHSWSTAP